tara:strand:- start:644 stop:1555 length:912 start_codon:yes stop_codon:yes gene_type:complete
MVGSAIYRKLKSNGYSNLVVRSSDELDLTNQSEVENFFKSETPEYVFVAAAKVGGILANNKLRAEFIYENLMIQNNIIHYSHKFNVEKLIFLGSSCIYPKLSKQPIKEEYLLTGELEYTNEPYAIAKIAGIKMCENYYRQYGDNFISLMPTNLYGPNDNFDLKTSHVLPALIRKFHEAKVANNDFVEIWGSGKPEREFLHVDDMAGACIHVFENIDSYKLYDEMKMSHINVGSGKDLKIKELSKLISKIVGFEGKIKFNLDMPDGTPKKLLDVSVINSTGWKSKICLEDGIKSTYEWFLKNKN